MIISALHFVEEDLNAYAWGRLRLSSNPEFTTDKLMRLHQVAERHRSNVAKQALEVRSCLVQAQEYFASAERATLATQPLLLYYGAMSMALAQVLVRGTGDDRLAQLRQRHNAHGLSIVVDGKIDPSIPLSAIVERIRAKPQYRNAGEAYGTFEVWRKQVREMPVPVRLEKKLGNATATSYEPMFIGVDVAPKAAPANGYPLLDALAALPQLRRVLGNLGVASGCVRANLSADEQASTKHGTLSLTIQPSQPNLLSAFYAGAKFSPSLVNSTTFVEVPDGLIVNFAMFERRIDSMSLPPAVAVNRHHVDFVVNGWDLGEFGSYFVALHMAGNLVRYFPDIWMLHVERSTALSLLIQELCSLATSRLPVLTACELDRTLHLS